MNEGFAPRFELTATSLISLDLVWAEQDINPANKNAAISHTNHGGKVIMNYKF